MSTTKINASKAQVSRGAIQRLHVAMRHLFMRGAYKPLGISGETMVNALLELEPEIYGSIADPERVELDGLLYIFQRLPEGIEETPSIRLIGREGYENSFEPIIPSKRRRNCYRIDGEQMLIEMTRGRSDVYDVLTHLTFLFIESEKIRRNALDQKGKEKRDWIELKKIIKKLGAGEKVNEKICLSYLSTLLGRTLDEVITANKKFNKAEKTNSLTMIAYNLGRISIEEFKKKKTREISFSSTLREALGIHIHGERWSNNIKSFLDSKGLLDRPIHIISSNLHSVMNSFYAKAAVKKKIKFNSLLDVAEELSIGKNKSLRNTVLKYAHQNGMYSLEDQSGANIGVQIYDCSKIKKSALSQEITGDLNSKVNQKKVLIVMDYAFGQQAYECMDELLKPYKNEGKSFKLDVRSINILGKAGILQGEKGDIMVPQAHIFEGSADNYPFLNKFDASIFKDSGLQVFKGPMITVLGTSLQNKEILRYFAKSSWQSIGLEMEGAHYQKAIQSASQIRNSINKNVELRYAYYASDNPLETGATLSSGALGKAGVKPTYLITISMLNSILN